MSDIRSEPLICSKPIRRITSSLKSASLTKSIRQVGGVARNDLSSKTSTLICARLSVFKISSLVKEVPKRLLIYS